MPTDCILFQDTGYFSSLICDYLDEVPELKPFYNRFPKLENFKNQIAEKQSFSDAARTVLVSTLKQQYQSLNASQATLDNIEALANSNTFTIATGHQLNLFTGPLYFLYKIISAINLTKQLKEAYPENNFVPVYWMATEDHDFEEINYFNFKGQKIQWNYDSRGAVGRLDTGGLQDVFNAFNNQLGSSFKASQLKKWFQEAYLKHGNLADATRFLANELFKEYGLVIIDADDKDLKRQFIPFIEQEITNRVSNNQVSQTNEKLNNLTGKNYNIQVNPREINLFYLDDNLRERIVFKDNQFSVLNTTITWTLEQLLSEVKIHPEKFSPNVLMRPLYQEVALPNLCYIGGGGELAYWLQLKSFFNTVNVPFPMLLLRNSVLIQTEKQLEKLQKLGINTKDLFLRKEALIDKKIKDISSIDVDFTPQKQHLQKQFKNLYKLAEQTDKSFLGVVAAQERKQIKGLEHLEKRLLKAQKRKLSDQVERLSEIKEQLFPNDSLQERTFNFSEFYLEYGDDLIPTLIKHLQPLQADFLVLSL